MARKTSVTLDGKTFDVHAFNVKELIEVSELLGDGTAPLAKGMKILDIALRRADPACSDFETMEPTVQELNAATEAVLKLSGIDAKANPQAVAPAVR